MTRFLTDKYVKKLWVDTDMKYDPLYLFENKRSRFEKFLKRAMGKVEGNETPREGGPAKAKAPVQAAAAAAMP